MQILDEDRVLHYENHMSKRKKKRLARKTTATNPTVIMSDGKPMVKTSALPKKKKKKKLFKKLVKGILTGGVSTIVADRKKIGKGIVKGAKAVGKAVKAVTKASLLLPLAPLAPAMRKSLKKKGLNPPKKLDELARMFHKVIVKKESTFDRTDHLAPIAAIIPPVIAFVKSLIGAKKKGAKLPPEENVIADEAEKVINAVVSNQVKAANSEEQAAEQEGAEIDAGIKTPDGKLNFKSPWVIGAAVAVLLAVIMIVRRK